jgi:hypothetical protein
LLERLPERKADKTGQDKECNQPFKAMGPSGAVVRTGHHATQTYTAESISAKQTQWRLERLTNSFFVDLSAVMPRFGDRRVSEADSIGKSFDWSRFNKNLFAL